MDALDEDFFKVAKQYLITLLEGGYYKSKFFFNKYFYGILTPREEVIQRYQKYTWTEFQEVKEIAYLSQKMPIFK